MAKGYQIGNVSFRPYHVLVLGHSRGWSSVLIPGSGEPNFDSWVANPYETSKQRREKEIHNLLDKLPPETIMLDPSKIGTLRTSRRKEKPTKEMEEEKEAAVEAVKEIALKKKTKGRAKTSKRVMKRKVMVDKAKKPFLEKQKQEEEGKVKVDDGKKRKHGEETQLPASLQRFVRKKAA